jgi:hypothetical protein
MIIGLDYDNTYTRDPEGWTACIKLMQARGHEVVLVTSRSPLLSEEVKKAVGDVVDGMVFAGHIWKRTAAQKNGWDVDVWIDDLPVNIAPQDPEIAATFSES